MSPNRIAASAVGPIQMPGLSHRRSCAAWAGPILSIMITNTNNTMMAPA